MRIKLLSVVFAAIALLAAGCSAPAAAGAAPPAGAQTGTPLPESAAGSESPDTCALAAETGTETAAGAATPAPEPTPSPAPAQEPLAVNMRTLIYNNAHIDVNIAYPEIGGMADAAAQSGINAQVPVYLQDKADAIEAQAIADDASGPHGAYFIESAFEVKRNDGAILSIRLNITYYEGGANTGSEVSFINVINTDPAQQPALAELFIEGADYIAALNDRIEAIIAADDPEAFAFEGISPSQGYYLTDTDLVIVFKRYTIAAGAYGEPEFEIPLASLSDILIPGIL